MSTASKRRFISPALRRLRRAKTQQPVLPPDSLGGPSDSPVTLAMVCGSGFNYQTPSATASIRMGFCHGFARANMRYELTSSLELGSRLADMRNPFVFLSCYDYPSLSDQTLKKLRRYPHFVWVPPWFTGMERVFAERGYFLEDAAALPKSIIKKILTSEPTFVWAPTTPSALEFFSEWGKRGQRFEPIALACDQDVYFPTPSDNRFSDISLAFVGGYRDYKNIQYEKYLRPWESQLTVFGVGNPWPYSGYRGPLDFPSEKVLYQNATLCPALSEPHAELTGDVVERIFKVLGSGGTPIADVVSAYKDLFEDDEVLLPESVEEYHEMVREVLVDEELRAGFRQKGYAAVMNRHTYEHRARQIIQLLGLNY